MDSRGVVRACMQLGMRAIAHGLLRRANLQVVGLEHVSRKQAVLIAARHYHHLYDGAAMVASIPRPLHLIVALDWAQTAATRRRMEMLCSAAEWPVALRSGTGKGQAPAFQARERFAYVRRALRQAVDYLGRGEVVAIFPEGAPFIDPHARAGAPQQAEIHDGFCWIVEQAQRESHQQIPIIPLGFHYQAESTSAPRIVMRLGAPLYHPDRASRAVTIAALTTAIRALSLSEDM